MTWAVAIDGDRRQGAVLSRRLVLTAAHGLAIDGELWVRGEAREIACRVVDLDADLDVALVEPASENDEFPESALLVPRRLFRGAAPHPDTTYAWLSTNEDTTARSYGVKIHPSADTDRRTGFEVPNARQGVRVGDSGGPVVEIPAIGRQSPKLLGIVVGRAGDAIDAGDNAGFGWLVPVDAIASRFADVAELVETPVERDPRWTEHWEPRSRGVVLPTEPGYFFTGQLAAYNAVRDHLDAGSGLLVVTGARGRGKSALLSRAVVLGCPRYLREHPKAAAGYLPPTRPVDAAVFTRGLGSEAVAARVGEQLGLGATSVEWLGSSIARVGSTPSIVLDAVDESLEPRDLMNLVRKLVDSGARVAVGSLATRAPSAPSWANWVDLDGEEYADEAAIEVYVRARLTFAGKYAPAPACAVAAAVAARAKGTFLVAELISRTLAERDPIDTTSPGWRDLIPADLSAAFWDYLARFGEKRERVLALLHPLAHSYGDGLTVEPADTWVTAANALRPPALEPFTAADVREASREAADYLLGGAGNTRRLYHEGLADTVRRATAQEALEGHRSEAAVAAGAHDARERFVEALVTALPDAAAAAEEYQRCDPYLLAHLPRHLADVGQGRHVLDRPGFLLAADQEALRSALVRAAAEPSGGEKNERGRVGVLHALAYRRRDARDRGAAIVAALRRQGATDFAARMRCSLGGDPSLPYELLSGPPLAPVVATIVDAHSGGIWALTVVDHDGAPLIISAGRDGAILAHRCSMS